jgi:hypothetical protein
MAVIAVQLADASSLALLVSGLAAPSSGACSTGKAPAP